VPAEGSSGPILKVAVFADGRVTLNGKVSSVNELKKAFIEAKKNNGVV
jgi:osmotically-inducible protein OsmY